MSFIHSLAHALLIHFKLNMAAAEDMLLPIILSEFADSDDEKPRRGKTREWVKRRGQFGIYETLVKELIVEDRMSFKQMFRMSVEDFEIVLSHIDDLISPQERARGGNRPILSNERLALTLRFLATGESFHSLSFQFRISLGAVSYIIKGCCDAIVERMLHIFVPLPSTDEWGHIAERFEHRWNYPHALGAIDGKHVTIKKPDNGGSFYFNYKKTHSIILMAIAGPDYQCLWADVGSNGRTNDGGVWNKSQLQSSIEDGVVELPKNKSISDAYPNMPFVFLGDDAFALKTYMMKPYPQNNLTVDRRIYNYRHSRARRISENLFGILANKWRIYHTTIPLSPKRVENIILTTLALHNMLCKSQTSQNTYRPNVLVDSFDDEGNLIEGEWREENDLEHFHPLQVPKTGHNSTVSAKTTRENFKDFFMAEGAVQWQWKYT